MRVAALRDITERKQAEEAIRARNALLSSIIESPDSAIFSIDREYRYTSFNRQHAHVMKSLFGVEIEIGAEPAGIPHGGGRPAGGETKPGSRPVRRVIRRSRTGPATTR